MTEVLDLTPELRARVDAVAARSHRSPAEVVVDALDHGHSLARQEHFAERVQAGLEDADARRFAAPADFERLRNKYRPT